MTEQHIIQGDFIEHLADVDADIAVQIVDPPYSANVHGKMKSNGTAGAGVKKRDAGYASLTGDLQQAILTAAGRVSRWSCIFSDIESAHLWQSEDAEYIRTLPWVRWSQPQLSGDRPPSGCEMVTLLHPPGKKHWNGPGSVTHLYRRSLRANKKIPKRQGEKPIDLMLDLVSWFSDPGDWVLDGCAGNGTTALACRLLGRNCISFELDESWAGHAARRLASPLNERDLARAQEWIETTAEEARRTPAPKAKDGSDVKTWERAQRRLQDVDRVRNATA